MIKIIFSIVLTIFSLAVMAQRKMVIVYLETGSVDMRDFQQDIEQMLKEKKDELKDSSQRDSLVAAFNKNKEVMEAAMNTLTAQRPADTVRAWLENGFLVTKETSSPGQRLCYHLKTLRFIVVDSFLLNGKIDTTRRQELSCADCTIGAKQDKAAGTRMIAGYACVKFTITQKSPDQEGNDVYTIWATDKIKPALPAYATLRLHKKVLPEYTMLEMHHPFEENSRSHAATTTLRVEQ